MYLLALRVMGAQFEAGDGGDGMVIMEYAS